ncbi:MAG: RNase P subunit p30 family protein [Halobacteriota archaeon]
MYELVRCHPVTRSTASRMASTAREMEYEGVVLRNPLGADVDDALDYDVAGESELDVDVVRGVEVRAETVQELHGSVGSVYRDHDVVCVRGGSHAVERAAAASSRVDLLSAPREFDHVTVREAAENDVALEYDLSRVLRGNGGERVETLVRLRLLRRLARKYDASLVVTASPDDHLEMRSRRALEALACETGMSSEAFDAAARASTELAAPGDADVEVVG